MPEGNSTHWWLQKEWYLAQTQAPREYQTEPQPRRIPEYWEEGLHRSAYVEDEEEER